jgi:hypothetical protein
MTNDAIVENEYASVIAYAEGEVREREQAKLYVIKHKFQITRSSMMMTLV